jgi:hypothetical protein
MITPQTEVAALRKGSEIFRAVFPPGEYIIGREGKVSILLPSEKVSRQHARLTLNYFDWMIEDVGSANGTLVGDVKIEEMTHIFPRQEVKVWDVELQLRRLTVGDADQSLARKPRCIAFCPRPCAGKPNTRSMECSRPEAWGSRWKRRTSRRAGGWR